MRGTAERRRVLATARRMLDMGLVVGSLGNVSARVRDRVLITPSAHPYDRMRPWHLVVLDARSGSALSRGRPSREAPLHAAIYARRPDVRAVIHTHSPCATAWSFMSEPLGPPLEELAYYDIGGVRTAPYAPAGSAELGKVAAEALGTGRAVLLARHGVVSTGATLDEALTIAAVVEHQARIGLLLRVADRGSAAGLDQDLDLAGGGRGELFDHLRGVGERDPRADELRRIQAT